MSGYCYFNGKIIPESQAHISINDLGVLRGFGIFDLLRTYHGKPFLLDEHLERLENSAAIVGLKVPISRSEIKKIIQQLIEKNGIPEVTIRLVLTGGGSLDGMSCNFDAPTFFIVVHKAPQYPAEIYEKGIKVITHDYLRNSPLAKT